MELYEVRREITKALQDGNEVRVSELIAVRDKLVAEENENRQETDPVILRDNLLDYTFN